MVDQCYKGTVRCKAKNTHNKTKNTGKIFAERLVEIASRAQIKKLGHYERKAELKRWCHK